MRLISRLLLCALVATPFAALVDHPSAPRAYPEINGATRPLRAEAARRGDPHGMSLWAGQGFRRAEARPAAEIVERVTSEYRAI